MWEANRQKINALADDKRVLDIGGWAEPLLRANYIMDVFPYETRSLGYHGIGCIPRSVTYPEPRNGERFTRDTWVIHDICSQSPFPFPDKMFDFVVCSHTLEDVRDPIRACNEIMRVGRAGYIETPARLWEQTMRPSGIVGEGHHRWMVQIEENTIRFYGKPHFLHTSKNYYVPNAFVKNERIDEDKVTFLFWEDSFSFEEPSTYWNTEVANYISTLNIQKKYYLQDRIMKLRHRWWHLEEKMLRVIKPKPTITKDNDCWTWEALITVSNDILSNKIAKQ